jgi:hypothetical protein
LEILAVTSARWADKVVFVVDAFEVDVFEFELVEEIVFWFWLSQAFEPLCPISFLCLKLNHFDNKKSIFITQFIIGQAQLLNRIAVLQSIHEVFTVLALIQITH